ncbi:MAG: hypothetical protein RLZ98_1304 [Pseudomonadota bacterium]|jgi:uncharacterized Fe-S cluster-containing radical SAM superfamily protein
MAELSLLDDRKFKDPERIASGKPRAKVTLRQLDTLWINTGTLCNITCQNCYIESSPRNDRLVYISTSDVAAYLDEIRDGELGTREIAFTGGEPFMNPDMLDILRLCLERGFHVLVLTNAMRPMQRHKKALLEIRSAYPDTLHLRISIDHYTATRHEEERGPGTFGPTLEGLKWLATNGFDISVAGRTMWGESMPEERSGYAKFFADQGVGIDAYDPSKLVLFPEMDEQVDVPEITTECWSILGKSPDSVMCASSRMIVKRKGEAHPVVMPCTLLPYDTSFELGQTLADAQKTVSLNHPHCAKFCVLGGASCTG